MVTNLMTFMSTHNMNWNPVLIGILTITALSAGCTGFTSTESPTPTEPPPQLEIRAASQHDVAVTILENPNTGSILLDQTFAVQPGETLRFDDTLAETARYDVSVRVESGDSWNRTVVPGNRYVIEITADGEMRIAM